MEITKQPHSLRTFFATEMWERYGFYVVQSLLAMYMAFHLGWQDERVYPLVGSFTALTYLSPIIGGWIADHLIGQKKAIILGALVLLISYLSLALANSEVALMVSLAGIAVGTGLLKPNISSLLGNEYPIDSPLRSSGFTIFYMGITTGIILGTTLPSHLNAYFGWHVSFASAALGMIFALGIFIYGAKRYTIQDYYVCEFSWLRWISAGGLLFALWALSFIVLTHSSLANILFAIMATLCVGYLVHTSYHEEKQQRYKTMVILLLCIISVMFWAFYFQMFLSLTLFISRAVKPDLWGISFPPPYYVSVQSIGMLIFGFFIAKKRHQSKSNHHTGNKFLTAMVFMVIAYTLITCVCYLSTGPSLLSPLLFIPAYLLISLAELYLSPVGLAAITVLASRKRVSTMMGIFFVSLGMGGFLSGKLASLTAIDPSQHSVISIKAHYAQSFNTLWMILIGVTLVCFILNKVIKKLLT